MKKLIVLALALTTLPAFASMRFFDINDVQLGIESELKCGTSVNCSIVSGKLVMSRSYQTRITATATTLVASQCGSTVINSGAVAINLPEASAVLGCRFTFITANASNFDVNPDDADQILVLTNAAGDSIRNATLGNSVVLEAISASQWAPVGKEQGSYTDIN